MSRRFDGTNPLGYQGVTATTPPQLEVHTRVPNVNDTNFNIGTIWLLRQPVLEVWILLSLAGMNATWVQLYPGTVGTVTALIGNDAIVVPPDGAGHINVVGDIASGITTTGNAGTNTLTITSSGGGHFGETLTGDVGPAVPFDAAGNLNVITDQPLRLAGSTVFFTNTVTPNTLQLSVTDVNANMVIGNAAGRLAATGNNTVSLGSGSYIAATTGSRNTMVGNGVGAAMTTASDNDAFGYGSLINLATGSFNTAIGQASGTAYTTNESSNVLLASQGRITDANTMRLGEQGAGNGQVNRAFSAGIFGVTPGDPNTVPVIIDVNGQLGTGGAQIAFTPVLSFGGASVDIVYARQEGTYFKIGDIVFILITIQLTSQGSSVGDALISGLPFVANPALSDVDIFFVGLAGITLAAGYTRLHGAIASNSQTVSLNATGDGVNVVRLNDTNFANNSFIKLQGFYFTA